MSIAPAGASSLRFGPLTGEELELLVGMRRERQPHPNRSALLAHLGWLLVALSDAEDVDANQVLRVFDESGYVGIDMWENSGVTILLRRLDIGYDVEDDTGHIEEWRPTLRAPLRRRRGLDSGSLLMDGRAQALLGACCSEWLDEAIALYQCPLPPLQSTGRITDREDSKLMSFRRLIHAYTPLMPPSVRPARD